MAIDFRPQTPGQVILNFSSETRKDLSNLSSQIASGQKYRTFIGYANEGNVEKFISFRETLDGIDSYKRSTNSAIARLRTTESSLNQLQLIADDFAALITNRRNSAAGSNVPVALEAESALNRVADNLNTQFDNRYLFAGTKTNTQPVTNVQTSNLGTNNAPTSSYYQGNTVKSIVRVTDTQEISYGVLANDSSFQKLIGAMHLATTGHNEDDDAKLKSAMDMVNEAIVGIAGITTTVKSTINTFEGIVSTHTESELLVSENLIDVSDTDIVEATSKMSELEAQLQASFLAFSRLSRLKLSDFL